MFRLLSGSLVLAANSFPSFSIPSNIQHRHYTHSKLNASKFADLRAVGLSLQIIIASEIFYHLTIMT